MPILIFKKKGFDNSEGHGRDITKASLTTSGVVYSGGHKVGTPDDYSKQVNFNPNNDIIEAKIFF